MTARWWTAADDAEEALLVHELVDGYCEHRSRCDVRPCPHLGEALEAVLGWRRRRELKSRAAFLRALEDGRVPLVAEEARRAA